MSPPTGHAGAVPVPGARRECRSSAAALGETLEGLGVEYIFGMDAPAALHAELKPGGITPITARDERSAAVMADSYARVSGKPGVIGVGGVGATNLIQTVIESWLSSTPVVVLVEEGSGQTRHRNDLQDLDRGPMFAPITKWVCQIENPDRVSDLVAQGFRIATTGRPGPVYIGCPWDVVSSEPYAVGRLELGHATYPAQRVAPDPAAVKQVAELITAASRPCIVAGGGVLISNATGELDELARAAGAPIATTPGGKGSFDELDPRSAGIVGSYTSGPGGRGQVANDIVHRSDLVILVGTKTGSGATANWTVPGQDQTVVHIDVDAGEIGRNFPGSIPLVCDAKLGLAAVVEELAAQGPGEDWALDHIAAGLEMAAATAAGRALPAGDRTVALDPLFAELADRIDDNTVITADAGYCAIWALDRLHLRAPGRRFVGPRAYGSLGYGLPAAIGAKLADPAKWVICVTGDGGFGYVLGELETAARYGVAVTVIVLNNRSLGWSLHYNRKYFGRDGETSLLDADYAAVARALGCEGAHVTNLDEFSAALASAMVSDHTTVIDVSVDAEARPPVDMFD